MLYIVNRGDYVKILRGYIFRLYPNIEQRILINKTDLFIINF